jgi:hypothetical protein
MSSVQNTAAGGLYASWERPAVFIGAAALLLCAVASAIGGAFYAPHFVDFFRAYLVGYMLWLGVALGGLALLMISRLTGGAWADQIRPALESAAQTLPLLALLFLPIVLGAGLLYPWADKEFLGHNEKIQNKAFYLNVPFFAVRAAIYFGVWITLGLSLVRGLRRLGPAPTLEQMRRLRAISAVGLGLYGLTITFAVIDWTMSLTPEWFSTIYGAMLATGQLLAGMGFAVAITLLPVVVSGGSWASRSSEPPNHPTTQSPHKQVLNDLGNLMLAFTMIWAYMAFSQFLLIWSGNLPEEITWYLHRLRGGWQWFALAILVLQFAVPFCLLLSRDVKRNPRHLFAIAVLILVMRAVDLFWVIAPSYPPGVWLAYLLAPFAVVGLGGLWLGWFLRLLLTAPPAVVFVEEGHAHD